MKKSNSLKNLQFKKETISNLNSEKITGGTGFPTRPIAECYSLGGCTQLSCNC